MRLFFLGLCFFISFPANAQVTLNIKMLVANGNARTAYLKIVDQFKEENPDIKVQMSMFADSEYKNNLDIWLGTESNADVLYWQAGERLFELIQEDKILPITEIWNKYNWDNEFSLATKNIVSMNGEIYAVPLSYYYWGVYYKKSVFKRLGLSTPKTWEEFLLICERLAENNIIPITIGTKSRWPSASWFDYINLRTNGIDFHRQLLRGHKSYNDPKVLKVVNIWKKLLDKNYFIKDANKYGWVDTLPYLYRELAGMSLQGNYYVGHINKRYIDDIGFFSFPIIDPSIKRYEEMPLDIFMIPKHSQQPEQAKNFIAYLARADVQRKINSTLNILSANTNAKVTNNEFIKDGYEVLQNSAEYSQYYDRDASKEMAKAATEAFTQFINDKDSDALIKKLEKARTQ